MYENGSEVYKDNEAFFFKNTPTYTNDILISKKDENFCPTILLGLLTGLYYVKKKPWQPEIGDVYFYVTVDEGKNKGVIHSETLLNKNDIKFLLLKKAATKVTPAVDKYMLAWSAVKGRYINSSVSNKKVNSAAIVECKGFKVRERQI